MCISIFALRSISVSAYTGTKYGNLYYTKSNGAITITDCIESATTITIPNKINGYPVTRIGDNAFYNCSELTDVTIPNTVEYIGSSAFYKCEKLTQVTIPGGVTTIWDHAFAYCNSLTSVTLSNGVEEIDKYAFYGCKKLNYLKIPSTLKEIDKYAFNYCDNIEKLYIDDINSYFTIDYAFDHVPFSARKIYVNEILLENITIDNKMPKIPECAFYKCTSLTSVEISEGVTYISERAFSGCSNLKNVIIPSTITSMGEYAFGDSSNIENVYISDLKSYLSIDLGDYAYQILPHCPNLYLNNELLTEVVVPEGINKIPSYVFYNNKNIKSVKIPEGVTSIGNYAFNGCDKLTSITIPKSINSIGTYAFSWCDNLKNVYINDLKSYLSINLEGSSSLPHVPNLYLNDVLLTDVIIPNDIKKIANGVFYKNTNITSVTIPDGVTSIGEGAFSNCSNLANVTIGNDVTSIGASAFYNCKNLKNVHYNGTEEQWNAISIGSSNSYLTDANRFYFYYLTLIDENGTKLSKTMQSINTCVDVSEFEEKSRTGFTFLYRQGMHK